MRSRRKGFGDATQDAFNQQLMAYGSTLLAYYRQKASIVAERESLRFQYLTSIKAQLQGLLASMNSQMYSDKNPPGFKLVNWFMGLLFKTIPMTNLQGGTLDGWGQMWALGGRLNAGFLSPTEQLLSMPFNDAGDPDQRPAYQIYGDSGFINPSVTPDSILADYFMLSHIPVPETGISVDLSMPPTTDWLTAMAYYSTTGFGTAGDLDLTQIDYLQTIIGKSYNGLTLKDVLNNAYNVLYKIIEDTQKVVHLQYNIDDTEGQLAEMVAAYKDQISNPLTVEQILQSLKNCASQVNATPQSCLQPSPSIATSEADSALNVPTATVPASTSKLPLIAAAIIGTILLGKD